MTAKTKEAMQSEEARAAYAELVGVRCACGLRKREQRSFCSKCYEELPKPIKNELFVSFSGGYMKVYKLAVEFLQAKGRIPEAKSA